MPYLSDSVCQMVPLYSLPPTLGRVPSTYTTLLLTVELYPSPAGKGFAFEFRGPLTPARPAGGPPFVR